MKKVAITGGPPVTVCAVQGTPRGATWGPDGTIIFATNATATGLQRVSAAGGEPTVLTKPDRERGEGDHLWPEFLPGGEAVLFTITPANGGIENAQIAVLDLQTGTSKVLIRGGSHAHYVPTGHLVYGVTGTLRAVAFDLGRLEVVGTPAPVLEGVVTTATGAADVAVAANGSLVYVPGVAGGGGRADRRVGGSPGTCLTAAWPPAGLVPRRPGVARRRAARSGHPDGCVDVRCRARHAEPADDRPCTGHAARSGRPTASASSLRRAERATRSCSGGQRMAPAATSGSSRVRRISVDLRANGWSADGRQLLFTEVPPSSQCAIGQIAIERPSDANVLVKSEFCNDYAAVSPDGRWMAYELERVRSIRDLRRAVSGARKSAADLDGRRPSPTLVA